MEIFNIRDASFEEIRQLQLKELELIKYFDSFCKENNLKYMIAAGNAIGAVRHGGYIPWDDDTDIFMIREEYEKLYQIWKEKGNLNRYFLSRSGYDSNYRHTVMELKDNNTTFINKHSEELDIHHGVYIDIMPVDARPNNKFLQYVQAFWAIIFSIYNAQRLPDHQGKIPRCITYFLLKIVPSRKMKYKIWKYAEKQMSKYSWETSVNASVLTSGLNEIKVILPKEWYINLEKIKYEDMVVPIFSHYDEYLKKIYGDYMKFPKEEDRVPKHNTVYINLNNPYTKYKDIYYCKEK